MASVSFSGSILPTLNTQHVVGTISSNNPGFYVFVVDVGGMRAGDITTTGAITQATSWGTPSLAAPGGYSNEPVAQIRYSPPVPMFYGGQFFIKQTTGTQRWFNFSVINV